MEQDALTRYSRNEEGKFIIDIAMERVEDLYQSFDRTSPPAKKDLADEFAEYLTECARELASESFVVRIQLTNMPAIASLDRVRASIAGYFLYRAGANDRKLKAALKRTGFLFGAGLALLTMAVLAQQFAATAETLAPRLLAEGLTIIAWIAIWQSIATALIQFPAGRRNGRLFRRIAAAPIEFKPSTSA